MMSTQDMLQILTCRHEILFLFDCLLGNPNGDPDNGNSPRILMAGENICLVSDVCLKALARKWFILDERRCYIQQETNLNRILAEHAEEMGISPNPDGRKEGENEEARKTFTKRFTDARLFGAVLGSGPNFGQITGPVQIPFAKSFDPVNVIDNCITRVCKSEDKDNLTKKKMVTAAEYRAWEERQNKAELRTMGRKSMIQYGLFKGTAFVSAFRAAETGMTEADLELLLEALENMFEHNRTSSKGTMTCRGIVDFKHVGTGPKSPDRDRQAKKGCAHAHKLFDLVKVAKQEGVESPRDWQDYQVTFESSKVPDGVEFRIIGADWIIK